MTTPTPNSPTPDRPTIVTVLIDRSGSMEPLRGFVVEGANELLRTLDPATRVSIVQFDSDDPYEVIIDAMPAAEVTPIDYDRYQPRGGTPLFDAVGEAITRTSGQQERARVLGTEEPAVVLAIISDGYENASTRFSAEQVRRLIEHYQGTGWTVTYIGLGNDAFAEGARLGVDLRTTSARSRTRAGTMDAFLAVSTLAHEARTRRPANESDGSSEEEGT